MTHRAPQPTLLGLRPGSHADLDEVMQVMDSAFDPMFGEAWTRSQCGGILPMPGVELTLAGAPDGKVAGFSLHRTVAAEAELLLLAVAPERRRRGFGRGLLDHFIADARAAGAEKVHLEVRENNAALAMYKAAGFRLVGRRRDYYCGKDGSRFDALTFAKDVTA